MMLKMYEVSCDVWLCVLCVWLPIMQWCRKGQCVKFGDHGPKAVHGQWSGWSDWSNCSRSCGGGVMYRERFCNSPRWIYLFIYLRQFHEYWAKRYEMQIMINITSVWMLIRGCKAERTVKPVNTTLIYMEIKTNTPREYQSLFYSLKVNTRFKENSYFMHWSEGFKIFVHSETFQEEP